MKLATLVKRWRRQADECLTKARLLEEKYGEAGSEPGRGKLVREALTYRRCADHLEAEVEREADSLPRRP